MIIKNFKASRIYGHLDINVSFFKDLTFLIGINGSGKTTAVRLIHSVLTPHIAALAYTDFEEAHVEIVHRKISYRISAIQNEKGLTLKANHIKDVLFIPKFEMPAGEPSYKYDDLFREYYKVQSATNVDNPLVVFLRSIPNPMYLGIERRAEYERRVDRRFRFSRGVMRRSMFAGSLADSLDDASELTAMKFREFFDAEAKVRDKLRNLLLLNNFELVEVFPKREVLHKPPSPNALQKISTQRTHVKKALMSLGLRDVELSSVDQFFDKMEKIVKDVKGSKKDSAKNREAKFNWAFSHWQFEKVDKLVKHVDESVAQSKILFSPIQRYLDAVNAFFLDSRKRIEIDRLGLKVLINETDEKDLSSLSSGEQQLLVLLTHLWFNPLTGEENVLIIDEPELSLHLAWQEKFADALLESSSKVQFILATHSPAIINERDNKCKELIGR